MLFRAKVLREVPVGTHMAQSLLVVSDAQADTSPTGGFIALVEGETSSSSKAGLGHLGVPRGRPNYLYSVLRVQYDHSHVVDLESATRGEKNRGNTMRVFRTHLDVVRAFNSSVG